MPVLVARRRARHEPVARHDDPGELLEVLGRADPLVRVRARARRACGRRAVRAAGSGRSPTSCATGYGGSCEVGLDDPGVGAGLAVDRPGEPHHPRALRARRVGDVRLAVVADAEAVDDPQVGALDRLEQLAGRLDDARCRKRLGELPVRVHAARAARLDQQVAGPLGQERPQRVQLAGLVDVDPQPAGLADRMLLPARRRARRRGRGTPPRPGRRGAPRARAARSSHPSSPDCAARQEVVGAPAGGDLKPAVTPHARRELDQPVGVARGASRSARARWRSAGSSPAKVRPSASRMRQRSTAGARLARVRSAGGGRCRHLLLPAQVWARPDSRPAHAVKRPAVT